jgi:hypothetical protein
VQEGKAKNQAERPEQQEKDHGEWAKETKERIPAPAPFHVLGDGGPKAPTAAEEDSHRAKRPPDTSGQQHYFKGVTGNGR